MMIDFSEACQICNSVYAECRIRIAVWRLKEMLLVDDVDNKEYLTDFI